MKRAWAILAISAACGLVGCTTDGSSGTASNDNNVQNANSDSPDNHPVALGDSDLQRAGGNDKTTFGATATAEDRAFIKNAAAGSMYEMQAGEKALAKSSDAQIKQIAQHLVDDHTKITSQLNDLAKRKRIDLTLYPYDEQTKLLARLDGLSGSDFDAEYLRQQKSAHADAISLFQTEANNAKDPDIRTFAAQTLPILRHHLDMLNNQATPSIGSER